MKRILLSLATLFFSLTGASADSPRFKFKTGETLQYHIDQKTEITETVIDEKTSKPETKKVATALDLVRQWKVSDVDAKGTATLEMSIIKMRWEQKVGEAEADVFDSAKPDELNKSVMAKNVGPVLAVLTVDITGKVIAVKETKVGPAHRFLADIPFKLAFPEGEIKENWTRDYTIQLDPPHGTGEKYAAKQTYKVIDPKNGFLIYGLTTDVTELPKGAAEQIPLIPSMQAGPLFFHAESGRYYGSRLKIEKELANHQGDGTSYKFVSTYTEDFIPAK
ncbi:hypothetical protein [Zavarzinella formosa]|uniref:hypothetical protein n=1 Tax=Zavarzinella formosa TaxID=360055 RepID=UPI000301A2CC|nr:hypothetical protein [Zavarzinella formosa]